MRDREYPKRLVDVVILWSDTPDEAPPEARETTFTIEASKYIAKHLRYEMARTGSLELRLSNGDILVVPERLINGLRLTNDRPAELVDEETGEVTPNE